MSHPEQHPAGATLIELLTSMAILSVILVMLSVALETSMGQFRRGTDRSSNRTSAQSALQWLERDLSSDASSRPAVLPRLPDSVTPPQQEFFSDRTFFPFEIDRIRGSGSTVSSLPNAAPEFARLTFVAKLAGDEWVDPGVTSPKSAEMVESIVGYYVAYTRDSPLAGETGSSMKLFRHVRPGGPIEAERYANGFLRFCHDQINDTPDGTDPGDARPLSAINPAAVRQGRFANSSLPFLLSQRYSPNSPDTRIDATAPWPALPLTEHLPSPPPSLVPDRGTRAAWENLTDPIHDTVFPDEAICAQIVRFELTPVCRVTKRNGDHAWLKAAELNEFLNLPEGEEWPCLVTPDFIDVTIAVIDKTTAQQLTRYEDWIIDWEETDPSQWSESRQRIERVLQIFHLRIPVRPALT